jgi:hypothetical protein
MKERREDIRRIEEALARHHRSAEPAEIPPFLARKVVMRLRDGRERQEAPLMNGSRLSGMVWRFTLVTCLMAVLLGAWGMSHDMQSQLQLAEFMTDDTTGIEWVQEFGML